eukprot:gene2615-533_t
MAAEAGTTGAVPMDTDPPPKPTRAVPVVRTRERVRQSRDINHQVRRTFCITRSAEHFATEDERGLASAKLQRGGVALLQCSGGCRYNDYLEKIEDIVDDCLANGIRDASKHPEVLGWESQNAATISALRNRSPQATAPGVSPHFGLPCDGTALCCAVLRSPNLCSPAVPGTYRLPHCSTPQPGQPQHNPWSHSAPCLHHHAEHRPNGGRKIAASAAAAIPLHAGSGTPSTPSVRWVQPSKPPACRHLSPVRTCYLQATPAALSAPEQEKRRQAAAAYLEKAHSWLDVKQRAFEDPTLPFESWLSPDAARAGGHSSLPVLEHDRDEAVAGARAVVPELAQ